MHELGHNFGLGNDIFSGPHDVTVMNYDYGGGGSKGIPYYRKDNGQVDYYLDFGRTPLVFDGTNLNNNTPISTENMPHKNILLQGRYCSRSNIITYGTWPSANPSWINPLGCELFANCPTTPNIALPTGKSGANCSTNPISINLVDQNAKPSRILNRTSDGEWHNLKLWPKSSFQNQGIALPNQ